MPLRSEECATRFPGGSSVRFADSLAVWAGTGSRLAVAVPATVRAGVPYRLLIQIFPDGRCGVAVNGQVVWLSLPVVSSPLVNVLFYGSSVGTRMEVGHVRGGTGIAPGIDWRRAGDSRQGRR